MSPSTIFIDNIEELLPKSNTNLIQQASKIELLKQIDKLGDTNSIKVCAATSTPWTLDPTSL